MRYTQHQTSNRLDDDDNSQSLTEDAMAGKRMSKTELVEAIANQSGLEKKQVSAVLDALNDVVYKELKEQNDVMVPGLLKLSTVTKPAVPEREGINPFTKEKTMFKAKPERKVIKARPVKALKDAV
ncbi:MAG TPA: HU family DNA-binding protein [Anaerolineales bacterium]